MTSTPQRHLHFDLAGAHAHMCLGVRRVAAFLGMSERFLEGETPRSLTLGSFVRRQFLPDPIPEKIVGELRSSWRTWIIGNALRELDQFLSLFLDGIYDMAEGARVISGASPGDFQWRRLEHITNAAKKHRITLQLLDSYAGAHLDDQQCLASLSQARNCLSHDLGAVTSKRAKDGVLSVEWLALQTRITQGDRIILLEEVDGPIEMDPDGPPGRVEALIIKTKRDFPIGTQMVFTPADLLDICLFYNIVADRVILVVTEKLRELGVDLPAHRSAQPV